MNFRLMDLHVLQYETIFVGGTSKLHLLTHFAAGFEKS